MITHYQRLLDYIVPDFVHVLADGRIARSGGKELALELEDKGYGWLEQAAARERAATPRAAACSRWRSASRAAQSRRSGAGSCALRDEARAAFADQGLPHTRLEEWRYTNVASLAKPAFALASAPTRRRLARRTSSTTPSPCSRAASTCS